MTRQAITISFLAAWMSCAMGEEGVASIALRPDPPIAVDGDIGEWSSVPGARTLRAAGQAVWGAAAWQGPEDCSGAVNTAWRSEGLLIMADIIDDTLRQGYRGKDLWKGDHVELYVDTRPDTEPERDTFGVETFHFGFSPGNFGHSGDPLTDCPPEAVCFSPQGVDVKPVSIAAMRTERGYAIEAFLPWSLIGVAHPEAGLPLRFETGISDADNDPPQQETLLTTSDAPWQRVRTRLPRAALAGSDGVIPDVPFEAPVFDAVTLERGKSASFAFTAPTAPEGKDACLTFKARLHTARVAGFTNALRVSLNGTPLDIDRALDRPPRVKARNGAMYSMSAGELFSVYYSPDFDAPESDAHYGLTGGVKACYFYLRVTDLLKEGQNTLELANGASPNVDNPLIVADCALRFRTPPPPRKPKAGPPAGPLPVYTLRAEQRTAYTATEEEDGRIRIEVAGETFTVASRFSCPVPAWVTGSCAQFTHERQIETGLESVRVRDRFHNLTDAPLGIMQRHEAAMGDALRGVWCAGLEQSGGVGSTSQADNPTTFGCTAATGIGLLAMGDVFRVHALNYASGEGIGLADNHLVLPAGGEYTAEWAIVPVDSPDYYAFINAARRMMDANFPIDGGFCFLRTDPLTEAWSDAQISSFLRFKDVKYACSSITYPMHNGQYSHGTAFQRVSRDNYRAGIARRRALVPEALNLVYFHCFLDVTEEGPERFSDARVLLSDGTQADYGQAAQRIYLPLEDNAFGRETAKNVDLIFDEIGADGVYWDEHEYSRVEYHFGEPWDGVSGDIDPKTMAVSRHKSSVTLLSEPWRLALAKRILARGPLIGNGAPTTRAMAALRFPCFVETGSITNCTRAHLYSPIALGDHLTERSEEDAYRVMKEALDYGCVYHWYNDVNVVPTHPHLTRYMFPITPLELHEGYIIGAERILTNRSGLFGWGDASEHDVHVFDATGLEVAGFEPPRVIRDGAAFTELRIAEDWTAAIIRKPAP